MKFHKRGSFTRSCQLSTLQDVTHDSSPGTEGCFALRLRAVCGRVGWSPVTSCKAPFGEMVSRTILYSNSCHTHIVFITRTATGGALEAQPNDPWGSWKDVV